MRSYDLPLQKEIVRLLKKEGITVRDNVDEYNNPIVIISESSEVEDKTKTFDRNEVSFTLNMWGSKNGSSVEVKELKDKVLKALTEGEYNIPGYSIDNIRVENVVTFKEINDNNGNKTTHYYQSILNIIYKIKGVI